MSDIDYAELRALLEATNIPLPLRVDPDPARSSRPADCYDVLDAHQMDLVGSVTHGDASLIAAAVNTLPTLLTAAAERDAAVAELAAVRAAVEKIELLVDDWRTEYNLRGTEDRLYTSGVVAMLDHALAATRTTATKDCNCGWGGVHDPDNLRCAMNTATEDGTR